MKYMMLEWAIVGVTVGVIVGAVIVVLVTTYV